MSLGAHGGSEETFRHFTFVTAGFHICGRFHICNRLATLKCENGYKCKQKQKHTNVKRMTVIVCDIPCRLRSHTYKCVKAVTDVEKKSIS